jgi:hypothetical protein
MEYMGSKQEFSTNKEENGWRRNSPIELKVHKNDVLASTKRLVIWSKTIMCRTIYLCSPGTTASCEDHHPLYGKWWRHSRPLDSFSFPSLRLWLWMIRWRKKQTCTYGLTRWPRRFITGPSTHVPIFLFNSPKLIYIFIKYFFQIYFRWFWCLELFIICEILMVTKRLT